MGKIDLKEYLERLEEPEDREAVANRDYQRELFLEYVVRDSNFPERRAELLRDFKAGQELTGPKGLRRKLGAIDLEYFGRAYLAHYFVRPSPPFHEELDRIFRDGVMKGMNPLTDAKAISRANGCRRAVEAPRGHAKSTTFTFKDSLHSSVYGSSTRDYPLGQLGTGRGLPQRPQDGARGERGTPGGLRGAQGPGLEGVGHPPLERRQDRGAGRGEEDQRPTPQTMASRPHPMRRSRERRERQHAGAAEEAPGLVL